MDTDSFIWIQSFKRGKNDSEHFDLSNLDVPDNTNKKVTCKLKYEFGSAKKDVIIGMMSKSYCINIVQKRKILRKRRGIR